MLWDDCCHTLYFLQSRGSALYQKCSCSDSCSKRPFLSHERLDVTCRFLKLQRLDFKTFGLGFTHWELPGPSQCVPVFSRRVWATSLFCYITYQQVQLLEEEGCPGYQILSVVSALQPLSCPECTLQRRTQCPVVALVVHAADRCRCNDKVYRPCQTLFSPWSIKIVFDHLYLSVSFRSTIERIPSLVNTRVHKHSLFNDVIWGLSTLPLRFIANSTIWLLPV